MPLAPRCPSLHRVILLPSECASALAPRNPRAPHRSCGLRQLQTGQVAAGPRPWGIDRSPDGALLYTANGSSNDVSVIDAATMKVVEKIPVGEGPWGAIVGPAPKR